MQNFDIDEFMKDNNVERYIFAYIRKNNQKKGILLGFRNDEDKISIGYSLCHSKKDKFNPEMGFKVALGRAFSFSDKIYYKYNNGSTFKNKTLLTELTNVCPCDDESKLKDIIIMMSTIPISILYELPYFYRRCMKYFKDCEPDEFLECVLTNWGTVIKAILNNFARKMNVPSSSPTYP